MRSVIGLSVHLPVPRYEAFIAVGSVAAFAAFLAACLAMSSEMTWIVFVPVLCLFGLIAAGIFGLATAGSVNAVIAILAVLVFLTDGSFRPHPNLETGTDWQSALKFVVWIACGAAGLAYFPPIGKIFGHFGAALWFSYICFALISAFYAPSPAIGLGYALSILCFYIFTFAVAETLSEATILWTITLTMAVFLVISWVVFYVVPDVGQVRDAVADGFELRMGGIAGQANALGSICAIYLGVIFVLAWKQYCRLAPALVLSALGFMTLLATDSRTALFSLAAGVAAVIVSRSVWLLAGMGLIATLGYVGVLGFSLRFDSLGSAMSRSGDPSELTTLTGRTQIWEFSWQKILESPFVGWGYNSSKIILAEYTGFANGLVVDHAHNLILQNLLSVGFIGTLPLFGLFLKLVIDTGRGQPEPLSVLFLVMVFVNGVSDPAAVGTSPTVLTLMFMLASLWPWKRDSPVPRSAFVRRRLRMPDNGPP